MSASCGKRRVDGGTRCYDLLDCLGPSQNVIQSARIPRIEATQPKTTVPISLGPHREPCWKLSEALLYEEPLKVDDDSGVSVLFNSILLVTCIVLFSCETVLSVLLQGFCDSPRGPGRGCPKLGKAEASVVVNEGRFSAGEGKTGQLR